MYAGDHLVGWANASVRDTTELPQLRPEQEAKGVVREDPIEAALHPKHRRQMAVASMHDQHSSTSAERTRAATTHSCTNAMASSSHQAATQVHQQHGSAYGQEDAATSMLEEPQRNSASQEDAPSSKVRQTSTGGEPVRTSSGTFASEADAKPGPAIRSDLDDATGPSVSSAQQHMSSTAHEDGISNMEQQQSSVSGGSHGVHMLERLKRLPWRRIDVCFRDTSVPFFAHNNIQVTRKWLNWVGAAVCEHLAMQIAAMEKDERIQQLMRKR